MASLRKTKNQVTFSGLIALVFLLFTGLCIVNKRAMNPNPLIHKQLWLGLPIFSSMFGNPEKKTIGLNSSLVPSGSINDASTTINIVDNNVIVEGEGLEKDRPSKFPSDTPGSQTSVISAENDEREGHLDTEEDAPFFRNSSLVLSNSGGSPTMAEKPGENPQLKVPKEEEEGSSRPRNAVGTYKSKMAENEKNMCNIYSGRWVKDISYPLYESSSCPYVDEAFNCQDNGRSDMEYQKWRWQANDCELPRFNATDFLERLRGKRLMLVGDSMNRNQFESLLCLLREGLSNKSRMFETHGYRITKGRGYYIFKFMDYNCTVEFCRSHFLVREGRIVRPTGKTRPTLMIDRIDKTAPRWKRANILVFNTGHWWAHGKTAKGKDYYQEGDEVYGRLDVLTAFRRALMTWGKWIDENLNTAKTHVFYRGYSPAHFRGGQWNSGGKCTGETQPIFNETYHDSYPVKMQIVEDVIHQMRTPVTILNITRLSEFRKDGHPSVYGKHLTELGEKRTRYQDCSHWCLPGVPDAWNELIYSSLVMEKRGNHN
ncbi:hypothetical protein KI387_009113 [Taxus chinensis]|uniref:Trichome birefringence-like N-terminal domain-containing protein n=1 Tax=Taxus chinensis TaxID=29808 RepID=A0AA38CWQ7_TAXCH|nr:hypothetical protein KI387_009113 [Taxus chinensis]